MDRLHFGARARRKARLKRIWMYAWLVSVISAAAGIPGTGPGLQFLNALAAPAPQAAGASGVAGFRGEFHKHREQIVDVKTPDEWTTDEIVATIYAAASEFGLSWDYLLSVAKCESSLNPMAYHPAGYHGLFQFDFTTWADYGYGFIYEPEAQARTAARLLAAGHYSRWPNCS